MQSAKGISTDMTMEDIYLQIKEENAQLHSLLFKRNMTLCKIKFQNSKLKKEEEETKK